MSAQSWRVRREIHATTSPNVMNAQTDPSMPKSPPLSHHGPEGFALTFTDYGASEPSTLRFPAQSTFSIHTEYDYRGQGECITLSTPDNTYFLYPLEEGFSATKLQFATEALWQRTTKKTANI